MKPKILVLVLVLAVVGLLASGCATHMVAGSWPTVIADAERAYVAAGPQVYAVDLRNGNEVWRFPEKASAANPFYAIPALTPDGEQLIVAGFDHKLYSLDPATGNQNWEFAGSRDRYYAGPLVTNDMIYAASADYSLYAVDFDGRLVWSYAATQSIWASPVSDGERVYFGALDRTVYALNALTGDLVWTYPVSSAILGSPALGPDGQVFVNSLDGFVYALDAETGETLWAQPFQTEGQIWASALPVGEALYVSDTDGTVYILDSATGTESQPRLDAGSPILNAPLLSGDTLIFGTEDGKLFLVTGEDSQTLSIEGKLYGTPALSGEMILIAPLEGSATLVATTAEGVNRWAFEAEK
jgi:outer membrane protein assembly factor BamB